MKKRFIIASLYIFIISITLTLFAGFVGPAVYWNSMKATSLNVWIVDKTVPIPDYREHKGLMWILNHNKIINSKTKDYFSYSKDYFGLFPINKETYDIRNLPTDKEQPNLIYLTDTYGVYTDDYFTPNVKGTRSDLIYGGLNKDELSSIKSNLGANNTIIGEFNIASAPTNEENRKELGKIFGVQWLGWKGRYFKDLNRDLEVPAWLVENYEKQKNKIWDYSGAGYVIVSDNDEIEILQVKKDIEKNGLKILFNEKYSSEFKIDSEIPYDYWFEFVKAEPGREIIASYDLKLTDSGKELTNKLGLPSNFPAVVRYDNNQYKAYYFAGDFADIQNVNGAWKYYGFDKLKNMTSIFNKTSPDYFYWRCYVPLMNKITGELKNKPNHEDKSKDYKIYAKTGKTDFQVLKDEKWEDFFVKGVNIGPALPGKWFTEFPEKEQVYLDWFKKIGEMNANTIRIYTLLPPEFYNALKYYNSTHSESPLWLLQEIWPEEEPEEHDYLRKDYVDEYLREIEKVVDAIHGKANIAERKGRAYGIYTNDVSEYVLGYLVGRELEPDEVIKTNEKNAGYSFKGEYLSVAEGASPTEAWLSLNCDYVLKYEEEKYDTQHPVAIVSWPTLDVVEHDSEWNVSGLKYLEYNDKVSVNINNILTEEKMKAGFFGAYHIYPNYPDFINNEIKYDEYKDEEGRFRYGGYLKEFIQTHTKYPALVAEFGLPTGMGNAHTSPDGYNHGGLTEEQQGNGIVRMMKAINREGYAGGLIFEWIDEWAKKTWITEPYMIPYDRHVSWHNAIDPEQNYGIVAMESQTSKDEAYVKEGKGEINKLIINKDSTFMYIDIALNNALNFHKEKLFIGVDTYDRNKGEFRFSQDSDIVAPTGLEFLLDFSGEENSNILVHPGYNIAKNNYSSYESANGIFEKISKLINSARVRKDGSMVDVIYQDYSKLNYGNFEANSHNKWYIEGNTIHIRIPWGSLNFTDPSSLRVLDDNRNITELSRDKLTTVKTDGIVVSALLIDAKNQQKIDMLTNEKPYSWETWDVPNYKERLKKSYFIVAQYFESLKNK